jgi:hypothetical protein
VISSARAIESSDRPLSPEEGILDKRLVEELYNSKPGQGSADFPMSRDYQQYCEPRLGHFFFRTPLCTHRLKTSGLLGSFGNRPTFLITRQGFRPPQSC